MACLRTAAGLIEVVRAAGPPSSKCSGWAMASRAIPTSWECLLSDRPEAERREKCFGSVLTKTDLEQTLTELSPETICVCDLAILRYVSATVMCAVCQDYDAVVVRKCARSARLRHVNGSRADWRLQEDLGTSGCEAHCRGGRKIRRLGLQEAVPYTSTHFFCQRTELEGKGNLFYG